MRPFPHESRNLDRFLNESLPIRICHFNVAIFKESALLLSNEQKQEAHWVLEIDTN